MKKPMTISTCNLPKLKNGAKVIARIKNFEGAFYDAFLCYGVTAKHEGPDWNYFNHYFILITKDDDNALSNPWIDFDATEKPNTRRSAS